MKQDNFVRKKQIEYYEHVIKVYVFKGIGEKTLVLIK